MAATSKRSAASATSSRFDVFRHARRKLTALYMLVIFGVTLLFSVSLYANLSTDLHENVRGSLRPDVDQKIFFQERDSGILETLLFVDAAVLAVAWAASYAFADYTLKPIREMMSAQEHFAADAAHELRTPLAVMRTQIEVQLRSTEALSEKARATFRSALEEIDELTRMTDDLLLLAREQGAPAAERRESATDVAEAAERAVERLRSAAEAKGVALKIKPSPALRVRADAGGLQRILVNLIGNAIKFTGAGGHVSVAWTREPGHEARLLVTDDGQGIPPEDLPHVFERFYKADNARANDGSGLGLTLAKRFAERYGGTVRIHSELGRGTEVAVRFKRAPHA